MTKLEKVIVVSMFVSFAAGIISKVYFEYLEHQARLKLPPEIRTPEGIQYHCDGACYLLSDVIGTGLMLLFFAGSIFLAFLFGLCKFFSPKSTLK